MNLINIKFLNSKCTELKVRDLKNISYKLFNVFRLKLRNVMIFYIIKK